MSSLVAASRRGELVSRDVCVSTPALLTCRRSASRSIEWFWGRQEVAKASRRAETPFSAFVCFTFVSILAWLREDLSLPSTTCALASLFLPNPPIHHLECIINPFCVRCLLHCFAGRHADEQIIGFEKDDDDFG